MDLDELDDDAVAFVARRPACQPRGRDGLIEHTARSKAKAMRSAADSPDRLTADLAAPGAGTR